MKTLCFSVIFFTVMILGISAQGPKTEYTEVLYGEVRVPCLVETLTGQYTVHYIFWENKWQAKMDAVMYGAISGTEYRFTTLHNVEGHRSSNPSLRTHNTATYTLLLWQGNKLIGTINGAIHNSFLDDRIVSEIENMHTHCK